MPSHGSPSLRVVLADDHPLYRRGLSRALARRPDVDLVGEAADGEEALALIRAVRPDVAVLDVRMPRLDGVQVCERLRSAPDAATPVLLLSAFDDPSLAARATAAGAKGFVAKGSSVTAICGALRRAAGAAEERR